MSGPLARCSMMNLPQLRPKCNYGLPAQKLDHKHPSKDIILETQGGFTASHRLLKGVMQVPSDSRNQGSITTLLRSWGWRFQSLTTHHLERTINRSIANLGLAWGWRASAITTDFERSACRKEAKSDISRDVRENCAGSGTSIIPVYQAWHH